MKKVVIPFVFGLSSIILLLFGFVLAIHTGKVAAQSGETVTQTVVVAAARDNTLYQSETGAVSNGAGEHFFVGQTQNGQLRRGVMAFDLTEAVPTNATIVSATLSLNMSKTSGGETAVSLHTTQQDWGEGSSNADGQEGAGAAATTGDATWLHTFFNSSSWNQPGGDFDEIPLATALVGGNGRYQWQSVELTDAVLSWYTNPLDNFGLMLIGNEDTPGNAKRFDTRENSNPNNHPTLTITYTIPAPATILYLPIIRK